MCEHAGIALIAADRELRIRTWNAAASLIFGASADSAIGTPLSHIIAGEERAEGLRLANEALRDGAILNFEFRHRDGHGRPRSLIATFSPIVDDQDRRVGVFTCIRDITRRISLENELANRRKMASLGEMAGALAHHFNNILGGAVTRVDFALTTDNPDFREKTLRQTSEAIGRVTKLVDSLLAFAEGDVRHGDLCDLTEVVLLVADYMEPELAGDDVKLELKLNKIPVTPVPRAQMVTVLENILHNAVDAMPHSGTASVETSVVDGVVTLAVTDTGCGMDEHALQRIFEPFFSTKNQSGDTGGHPGLGLAVAHGLLHVLGHKIAVSSQTSHGTTVTISFTGKTSAAPESPDAERPHREYTDT